MVLHMRKLCVGAESIEDLAEWQAMRLRQMGSIGHVTRMWPKRIDELLKGGSLYWIIKGVMRVRQPILGFEEWHDLSGEDEGKKPKCRIVLAPDLIPTDPWPHRPFQGWRYLTPDEAPPDLGKGANDDMPPELKAELRAIGAW
ncbi:MAG: DUF1489 domain-containing protein [Alphaproteobacteria bacterium]|nr:DUF1489 domain-containing protein [Alphaproteobacteria bacterium]